MPTTPEHILQRYQTPKAIKGARATLILKELRWLVRQHTLEPNQQFLALQLLLFLEGMIDRLPKHFCTNKSVDVGTATQIDPPVSQPDPDLQALIESLEDRLDHTGLSDEKFDIIAQ